MKSDEIKNLILEMGVDLCGIASVECFAEAPKGFHPLDIYKKTRSVLVFAKKLPQDILFDETYVSYTHIHNVTFQVLDRITFDISLKLDSFGVKNVLIPSDDPYEYWDAENRHGRAILSLRHAGYLAGLGVLGRNNLLTNEYFGSMILLGALLLNVELEPDPLANYKVCKPNCQLCLESCPTNALDGKTVNQKLCRSITEYKTGKGFILKKCYECRKVCPSVMGIRR